MKIHHSEGYGNGVIELADVGYSFSIESSETLEGMQGAFSGNWEVEPQSGAGFRVVPFGPDNNLPALLRDTLDQNNLAEGLLSRKRGLVWGDGPEFFRKIYKDGEPVREWVEDKEISAWMNSFNGTEYLRRCMVDYFHAEVVNSKIFRNRGARQGLTSSIAKLEHIPVNEARLQWPADGNSLIVSDWEYMRHFEAKQYPLFDAADPLRYPVAGHMSNMYSFSRKFYGVPAYFGALNWIRRASSIPRVLENLTNNSLAIKWHIISPAAYWDAKRAQLEEQCNQSNTKYTPKMLEDLKDEVFKKIGAVLSGEKNVGKFFTSESFRSEFSNGRDDMEKWEIIPIDQKVKDYIDAQI
jgi:hypothetical protein